MQALWMIVAALLFAFMGVCIKLAAIAFSSAEMIFYRGLFGVVFMWGLARVEGVSLSTPVPLMHAWRCVIGITALGCWFYSITHLPLATANSLNYTSSIWIAVFVIAGGLLSWRPTEGRPPINGALVFTVLAGFAGVLLLLRPTLSQDQLFAGLVGLLSGILSAFAYMQIMALSKTGEPETRIVFYFAIGTVIGGGAWMLATGVSTWSWPAAIWLLPIGLFASLAQWCMTRAYSGKGGHGSTLLVANLQYSGIIFSALLGFLIFAEKIPLIGWLGIALVIASGIAATVIRARSVPDAPAEEH